MDKENVVYIHNEVLFSHKEEWNRKVKLIKYYLKGGEGIRKSNRVNLITAHYSQVWKYHNETPLYN
jgi:hypothetical protein